MSPLPGAARGRAAFLIYSREGVQREKVMPYYRAAGEIPRKRHIRFRRPDGGLYAEELMGEEGFTSDSSLLYHAHPPTAIVKSEGVDDIADATITPNDPGTACRR
jgi:hypothetical protein